MRYPLPAVWRVRVVDVHDGDTITCEVDRGGPEELVGLWHVRLKGVFAPELKQAGGLDCRNHALGWVSDHGDGSDWPYLLETFRTVRSDVDVMTLSRFVGILKGADGSTLNDAQAAYVVEHGYEPGIGGS